MKINDLEEVVKGIWKLTIGEPEKWTPTSVRNSPIREEALEKISKSVNAPMS